MSHETVRFTFVRHGQSLANVSGRWQGHGDAELSELGRAQAEAVAARLRAVPFDHVVSSDLARARDTARALGVPVELDPRFREIDVGAWEGLSRLEVAELFPEEVLELRKGAEHVKVGGGESWSEAYGRIEEALGALRARLNGAREVGIFSHGGVISSLFTGLFDVRGRHPRPLGHLLNTAVTVASISADAVTLERYNDGSHHVSTARYAPERFGAESAVIGAVSVGSRELEVGPSLTSGVSEVLARAPHERRARALGETLRAPVRVVTEGLEQLMAEASGGRRALFLASPEEIQEAAAHALRPGAASRVRFAPPAPGSVTHLVRIERATLLGDYAIGA